MNKFIDKYPIYYINLNTRKDRNDYIIKHFLENKINNFYRIEGNSPSMISDKIIKIGKDFGVTEYETASSYSHINAIKYFFENSNLEYGFFCEDDVDLFNLNKIEFTVNDLFKRLNNPECIQLGISTREDIAPNFKAHIRGPWDFNCSFYVMTRCYAKKLLNNYYNDNVYTLENFIKVDILDYRNNTVIQSTPVPEYIVYGLTNAISCPISTYQIFQSSMNFADENYRQNTKTRNNFLSYWSEYNKIRIVDLI